MTQDLLAAFAQPTMMDVVGGQAEEYVEDPLIQPKDISLSHLESEEPIRARIEFVLLRNKSSIVCTPVPMMLMLCKEQPNCFSFQNC